MRFKNNRPRSSLAEIQASFANTATTSPFLWINPGPVNLMDEIPYMGTGPVGRSGKLQAFAWEPSHPKVMYAGGGNGSGNQGPPARTGAFKTIDGGDTWIPVNQGLFDPMINVLWVSPSNPNTVLAGTELGGLFRSTDAGESWTQVSSNAPVSAIVAVPEGILVGTGVGLELSKDGGATWGVLQRTSSPVRCMAANLGDIIVGLDGGDILWKGPSDQIGRTVASNTNATVWDVAIDPVDAKVAFYIRQSSNGSTILRTTDRGSSWKAIKGPNNSSQALAIRPSDRFLLVGGSGTYDVSPDFGETWITPNGPGPTSPGDNRKIFLLPGSSSMVMGTDQGLFWTDDLGRTWRGLTKSISASLLYGVAVNDSTIFTSAQDYSVLLSLDSGRTWRLGGAAEGGGVAINPGNPRYCYTFTIDGFKVSVDGCVTLSAVAGPTRDDVYPNAIAVDTRNPSVVYVAALDGVWRSDDWGMTLQKTDWPMREASEVVFDPNDPQAIYVCAPSGFYQSLNGGRSWGKLSLPTSSFPFSATISPSDSNVILVALIDGAGRAQGGILRSTDRGRSFHFSNQGLSKVNVSIARDQQSIAFDPSPPPRTIPVAALATSDGIYASADLGLTWQDIHANAITRDFRFVHWNNGYLWVATYGQGVLRTDQPLTSNSFLSPLKVTGGPVRFANTIGVSATTNSQELQVSTVGGSQNFTVTSSTSGGSSCGSWLSVSPASGTTTGTTTSTTLMVSYTVAGLPPYTSATCQGAVTVTAADAKGSTVTIPVTLVISPQPGYCSTPVVHPESALFGGVGGTGTVTFTLPSGCVWRVSGYPSWINITSATSGTGAGSFAYSVLPYTGTTRTGFMYIGGARYSVVQTAGVAYYTTTLAGGSLPATAVPGTSVTIPRPWGVAADPAGNLYFTGSSEAAAFKLGSGGMLTRVAGTGIPGYSGDGSIATSAQLSSTLQGIAVDGTGNLYIADSSNHRIRRVAADGSIHTVAGTGSPGFSGDGGPATDAMLNSPGGVRVDALGNLYIADTNNQRIRRVTPNGTITTIAGSGSSGFSGDGSDATRAQLNSPYDVAVDPSGNLYIADRGNRRVRKVDPNGTISTRAGNGLSGGSGDGGPAASAQLSSPCGLAVDAANNLYIADWDNGRIRRVTPDGTITAVAGNGDFNFYGDGGSATDAALNRTPGVAVDPSGNLYIADWVNRRVRKVDANRSIRTVAGGGTGDGSPAPFAGLDSPAATVKDGAGNVYVGDSWYHRIRKIAPNGDVSTVAGTGTAGYSGDGGDATNARLNLPTGVAVDPTGNVYFADAFNNRVRKVSPSGIITTVAGGGCCALGDGGLATSAQLRNPRDLRLDASGNLYVVDTGNARVRVVSPDGAIRTVAGSGNEGYSGDGGPATNALLNDPNGAAVDATGSVYIADTRNHRIRKVDANGAITTLAGTGSPGFSGDGGPASSAQLNNPLSVAVDAAGNIYIADSTNGRIRMVSSSGIITTLAGGVDSMSQSFEGGAALLAHLKSPRGITVDPDGSLYVSDSENNAIRLLTPLGRRPVLTIGSSHDGAFQAGERGTYTLTVTSAASSGPTNGSITVTEILPASLSLVTMSGPGWTCSGASCSRGDSWNGGTALPPITVRVDVSVDVPSQVTNRVTVSIGNALLAATQDLTITIPASAAVFGITNAASFAKDANGSGTPVAPGSLVSIFGRYPGTVLATATTSPLPFSLGGASVTFNGVRAPLIAVAPTGEFPVINAQVPFAVLSEGQPSGSANIVVTVAGKSSTPLAVPVVPAAPGVFTIPATGQGNAVLVFVDPADNVAKIAAPASASGSIGFATAPIPRGSVGLFYATGLGAMQPPVPDGAADSSATHIAAATPIVLVGGVAAQVQFAGQAPGLPGVNQINIVVPDGAPTGSAVPLQIQTADAKIISTPGATIAVR